MHSVVDAFTLVCEADDSHFRQTLFEVGGRSDGQPLLLSC